MQPVPIELPLKASEAAALADVLFDQVEGRAMTEDARQRFRSRIGAQPPSSFTVFAGSLQQDPIHPSVFYIAVGLAPDTDRTMLLRIALAAAPSSGLFPNALLIGRMRTNSGREIVISASSFTPEDRENLRTFAGRVDRAFAPRPQGTSPAIEVSGGAQAAFLAFRTIFKSNGHNLASVCSPVYETSLWAAIVSGWREGYTAATDLAPGGPIDPGFTKYNVAPAPGLGIEASMRMAEEFYDSIQIAKGDPRRRFDFEVSLAGAPTLTTPDELLFCLDFFKARDKPVQFIGPNIGTASEGPSPYLAKLAEVARSSNAILSIQSTGAEPPEVLEQIRAATAGRVNYKISCGLDPAVIVRLWEQLNL